MSTRLELSRDRRDKPTMQTKRWSRMLRIPCLKGRPWQAKTCFIGKIWIKYLPRPSFFPKQEMKRTQMLAAATTPQKTKAKIELPKSQCRVQRTMRQSCLWMSSQLWARAYLAELSRLANNINLMLNTEQSEIPQSELIMEALRLNQRLLLGVQRNKSNWFCSLTARKSNLTSFSSNNSSNRSKVSNARPRQHHQ